MIGAERQPQRRVTIPRLSKSIARLIKALEKELASLDADIDDAVRGSAAWRRKEDLLVSVPKRRTGHLTHAHACKHLGFPSRSRSTCSTRCIERYV
jgi:hypothetical protein